MSSLEASVWLTNLKEGKREKRKKKKSERESITLEKEIDLEL